MSATDLILRAIEVRGPILEDPVTNACRVFNGGCDGIEGLILEQFGPVLIAQLHEGSARIAESELRGGCAAALERLGANAVYLKRFPRDRSAALQRLDEAHRSPQPWIGTPVEAQIEVREHGLAFLVRPYDGYAVGLFLDQRANRKHVRELAAGRRVLNTFAYTCGFSVAAAAGGAVGTTSVDVSKRFLEWGKLNFAANGIALDDQLFICSDVFDYYRRAARQGRTFDLIVLDPPTFARQRRGSRPFVIQDDLPRLVAGAIERLNPQGLILLSTNHRGTTRAMLEQAICANAAGRRVEIVARPRLPMDFRGDPGFAKSVLARVH